MKKEIENIKLVNTNIDINNVNNLKDISDLYTHIQTLTKNYEEYLLMFVKNKVLSSKELLEQIPENKLESMLINGFKLTNNYITIDQQNDERKRIQDLGVFYYYCTNNGFSYYEGISKIENILKNNDFIFYFIIDPITNSIITIPIESKYKYINDQQYIITNDNSQLIVLYRYERYIHPKAQGFYHDDIFCDLRICFNIHDNSLQSIQLDNKYLYARK